jgi:hypothetical protein
MALCRSTVKWLGCDCGRGRGECAETSRDATLEFTGLAQGLGQLEGSYRDSQSNCWATLRILDQPCGFWTNRVDFGPTVRVSPPRQVGFAEVTDRTYASAPGRLVRRVLGSDCSTWTLWRSLWSLLDSKRFSKSRIQKP